jgi:hypothetical protein
VYYFIVLSCCLRSGIINHEKIKGKEYIHVTKIIIVQYFFPYELHENHEMKLSCTITGQTHNQNTSLKTKFYLI